MRKILTILAVLFTTPLVADSYGDSDDKSLSGYLHKPAVSVVALLGNPRAWNRRVVSVFGYVRYDLHGTLLFMSTEHCLGWNESYGIQLDLEALPELERRLEGTAGCLELTAEGKYRSTRYRKPKPGEIVLRERPGILFVTKAHLDSESDSADRKEQDNSDAP